MSHPSSFFLNAFPPPLVNLLLFDVQMAGERLECVVIPVGSDLEAPLEDRNFCGGSFAASADRVATLVESDSWGACLKLGLILSRFSQKGRLVKWECSNFTFPAITHLVSCEDILRNSLGA